MNTNNFFVSPGGSQSVIDATCQVLELWGFWCLVRSNRERARCVHGLAWIDLMLSLVLDFTIFLE